MERRILFCLVLLAIPALTVQQVCPDGYNEVDGWCFYIANEEKSFEQAKYDCMYRGGGSLVTINDAEDREDAMEGSSGPVPYWVSQDSLDVDFNSDAADLNCYICEAPPDFDYGAAVQAYNDYSSLLSMYESMEISLDTFMDDLSLYQNYDSTPLALLPDLGNMEILPEQWALTYSQVPGAITRLSLPETANFDPSNLGAFYSRHLSNLETSYANSRNDVVFDEATYGPNAACPYPPRTDLGGGFALERFGPTPCRISREFEVTDPVTARIIGILVGTDIIYYSDGSVVVATTILIVSRR
ncbi:ADP-ribosylation factor-like protein 13B [Branchiostoma belcheri]|nr:ADP-ribosylation factor-like protein 13B [Branchiostoma belcheri]